MTRKKKVQTFKAAREKPYRLTRGLKLDPETLKITLRPRKEL